MAGIIIPKGGYGPFHKVQQKKEKKQQRPRLCLFRNYKINAYFVSTNILDDSLNVWMVYLLACWGYFDSTCEYELYIFIEKYNIT